MTGDPFATAYGTPQDITEILRTAAAQIESANLQMSWIEEHQTKLIGYLHDLLDRVGRLEVEKNTWKFKAEELEHDCEVYKSRAEDLACELHAARQLNASLAIKTGEARCPECGSADIALLHGAFPTGVVAPDGGVERWYEAAWDCQACGHREEMAP